MREEKKGQQAPRLSELLKAPAFSLTAFRSSPIARRLSLNRLSPNRPSPIAHRLSPNRLSPNRPSLVANRLSFNRSSPIARRKSLVAHSYRLGHSPVLC